MFLKEGDIRTSHCKSSLCMHGEKIHDYGMSKIEGFRSLCRIAAGQLCTQQSTCADLSYLSACYGLKPMHVKACDIMARLIL